MSERPFHSRAGRSRRPGVAVAATSLVAASTLLLAGCGSGTESASQSSTAAAASSASAVDSSPLAVATDAYAFGYPLVLMDVTREVGAAPNHLDHMRKLPDSDDHSVVRLNRDTLYSKAWLDLRKEPVVLQVPAMEPDRYWLMQTMDPWSEVVQNPSSVRPNTGDAKAGPFTYLYTPPGWKGDVPAGMTKLEMPSDQGWLLGRIQVNGPADLPEVAALQDKMKIAPLSDWLREPGKGNPVGTPTAGANPAKLVAQMDGPTFFGRMTKLMAQYPSGAADAPALARFATAGIASGKLDQADGALLTQAVKDATKKIAAYRSPKEKAENGWTTQTVIGHWGTDYTQRARIAMVGLGANVAEDSIYPSYISSADKDGKPQTFRIKFTKDSLPPVNAFWSMTAYGADSFMVPNEARIYDVGHQMPLVAGPDGSYEIVAQAADPGPTVPRANWLPIPPSGRFSLTLRLYAPKAEATNGQWEPPVVQVS